MKGKAETRPSRREFLRGLGRQAALAGLAALAAAAVLKRRAAYRADCPGQPLCRGCHLLDRCRLPQAAAVRNGIIEK